MFAVRYLNGGLFDGGTSLLVVARLRSVTSLRSTAPSAVPAPFPLGQNQVVVFDEEENFETPDGCTDLALPDRRGHHPLPVRSAAHAGRQRGSAVEL